MKVFTLFNDIHKDGMGSAALTLVTALKAQGVDVVPVHAWREVDYPEYEEKCKPVFCNEEMRWMEGPWLKNMVEKINSMAEDGDVAIDFGSSDWLACAPYFKPGLRMITAVHSINPSTLKLASAYPERISAFVCISKGVEERFRRRLPKNHCAKIHLIPNAVAAARQPKTGWSNDGVLRILFLGRIENTSKGCGKIPKILKELKRRGIKAKLDLYGYFHNWEREWWKAVDKADVRDMVEYRGMADHDQVYDIMRGYDAFLTPSNFEGFPLSNSEAMSCALPIVTSRIVGVTDWICDYGKAGLLVDKMDIKGFADALEALAKDENLRRRIGEAGRERINALASFEAHGRLYAELCRAVSAGSDYAPVKPHCEIENYVTPEFLKPWGPARILPVWLKTWLRRFM